MIITAFAPLRAALLEAPPSLDVHVAVCLLIGLPLLAPSLNVTPRPPVVLVSTSVTARAPVGASGAVLPVPA